MHIEAVLARIGRAIAIPQVPFSEMRRGVSNLLQRARHRRDRRIEPVRHPALLILLRRGEMSVDAVPRGIMARHESRPARRAHRPIHVELREERAL
jgi:hypothetical protein